MPPTANLENVKAAKLQDGVLVIEVPVSAHLLSNRQQLWVSGRRGWRQSNCKVVFYTC